MVKSCINTIKSLFQMISTLLICQNIVHYLILFIVFYIAIVCYITNKNSVFYSIILK